MAWGHPIETDWPLRTFDSPAGQIPETACRAPHARVIFGWHAPFCVTGLPTGFTM